MLAKILTASLIGIKPFLIEVETHLTRGLPSFSIVGLPGKIIYESRERIISAIKNSDIEFPAKHIIVNLAPANIKKELIILDLPIAAAILTCLGIVKINENALNYIFLGELSLDGSVKKVKGILPILSLCKKNNIQNIVIPYENINEAKLIPGINIIPVKSIKELISKVNNNTYINGSTPNVPVNFTNEEHYSIDFKDVKGNHFVKRALEIAAAGMHNVIMIGPPGTGKSMLFKRIITILPEMNLDEAVETTSIYSSRGLLSLENPLIKSRPFRSPHHTSSDISIIGGGRLIQCGEISLAHNGILFFDEFPQYKANVIQCLREPLTDGNVFISRAAGTAEFPASFMFVAAMNPCPCGYYGSDKHECTCTVKQIKNYYNKISGPIMDRIDIQIEVPEFNFLDYYNENAEKSADIRQRVIKALKIQQSRINRPTRFYNSYLDTNEIDRFISVDDLSIKLLYKAIEKLSLSPRSYYKILKIARTIADLEASEKVTTAHIAEALQYRILDRLNYFNSDFQMHYINAK